MFLLLGEEGLVLLLALVLLDLQVGLVLYFVCVSLSYLIYRFGSCFLCYFM